MCIYHVYGIYMVYTWYIHGILYTPSGGWCCGGGRARRRAPTHLRGSAYILSRRHGHARAHARTSARPRTPERASTLRYSGFRARIPPTQKLQTKEMPEHLNDWSKLCMPAVPTVLIFKIPGEQEKNVCTHPAAHKRTVVPNTLMRALLIQ